MRVRKKLGEKSGIFVTFLTVDAYNSGILNLLPNNSKLFCAADSLEEHANISINSESDVLPDPDAVLDYVSKVRPNGMPDHTLLIKPGGVY